MDSPFVLAVSDTLRDALVSVSAEDAVSARAAELRLYCWWTL
ncbi:hypothetical protein [Streptomyces griseoluteus]